MKFIMTGIYRLKFRRDIYRNLRPLEKAAGDGLEEQSDRDVFSLERFEHIACVMAKYANPPVPDMSEEWPDQFNTFFRLFGHDGG